MTENKEEDIYDAVAKYRTDHPEVESALSLPNKSNEEIVEIFGHTFSYASFCGETKRDGERQRRRILDWLRFHLTQREIKLPEKKYCKKAWHETNSHTHDCNTCLAFLHHNTTIDLCQQAIERSGNEISIQNKTF